MTLPARAMTRETSAFVKLETAFGELAFPSSTDAIAVLDAPTATQAESFTPSREIVDSRSLPARFRAAAPAGSWSLSIYARPSGTAGVPPVEAVIMEAALGAKTVNAGASVVYSPALELPSLSLCYREGHTAAFALGCKVDSLKLNIKNKDAVGLEFAGSCKTVLRAGAEETVDGSTTEVLKLAAGGAKLFDAGSRVKVGAEDNSGTGYSVTAVDVSADTVAVSPALASAPAAGVAVSGFLPTASLAGAPVEGRSAAGRITLAGANLTIVSLDLEISNALKPDEDELTDDQYPSAIYEGRRQVTASISARFLRKYTAWFQQARSQEQGALAAVLGANAGGKLRLDLPRAVYDSPEMGGDETQRTMTVKLTGLASASLEDEVAITYE